ncbi:MAG: polysaccharide biosynthesis/export family protein [bacterium]
MKAVQPRFFVPILLLLFAAEVAAGPQTMNKRFNRGDALRLVIWQPWQIGNGKGQNIDLNGDYLIDNRGYVFFPLIGDVKVIGHNPRTVAEELKEKFSAYMQEPIIIVEPLIRVTLLGAFRRPGTYLVQPDASLWALVDLAEGPDDNSDLRKMYIERSGRLIKKSLLSGFERAYTLQELDIRSGDQILLPERKRFRVRDAFEILRFGVTLLNVYFLISRISD